MEEFSQDLTGASFQIGDIISQKLGRGTILFFEVTAVHFRPTNGSVRYEAISLSSGKNAVIDSRCNLRISSGEEYMRWRALESISR